MSISKLRKTVQKRIKVAGWILTAAIFISIPAYFSWGGSGLSGATKEMEGDIAKINGVKISRESFERMFSAMKEMYPFATSPDSQLFLRLQIFNDLVDDVILNQALKQEKIKVSDKDVDKYIQEIIDKEVEQAKKEKGKTVDEKAIRETLKQELEKQRDAVRRDLMTKKLREKVEGRLRVTEEDLKNSYKEVHLRGIKVDSEKKAQEIREKAKTEDFASLAKKFATSPSEKEEEGDMGWLPLEVFPPDVKAKLTGMKKGDVTIAQLGGAYFVLKLEDERLNLPKDFDKNKAKLLKSYKETRKQTAFQDYLNELRSKAEIQIYDPLIKAAEALQINDFKKAEGYIQEGLKIYHDDPNLLYVLGMIYEGLGKDDEALKLYQRIAQEVYMGQAYYRWGLLLEKKGKKQEAVDVYKKAAQYAGPDIVLHSSLKEKFSSSGLSKEAQKEEETIKRLSSSQRTILGGGNAP